MASDQPVEVSFDLIGSILIETERLKQKHNLSKWMFIGIIKDEENYDLFKFLLGAPYKLMSYKDEINQINKTLQQWNGNDVFLCTTVNGFKVEINNSIIEIEGCPGAYHISRYGQNKNKKVLFYLSVPYKSKQIIIALESDAVLTKYRISELFKQPN